MDDTANLASDGETPRAHQSGHPNDSTYRQRDAPSPGGASPPGSPQSVQAAWGRISAQAMLVAGGLALTWTAQDAQGPVADAVAEAIRTAADLSGWVLAAAAAALGGRLLLDSGLPAVIAIGALRSASTHAEQRDLLGLVHRARIAGQAAGAPGRDLAVALPLSGEAGPHDGAARFDAARFDAAGAGGTRDGRDGRERPEGGRPEPRRWSDAAWRTMHRQIADFTAALPRPDRSMPPTTRDTWPGEGADPPDPLAFREPWSRPGDDVPRGSAAPPAAMRCPACGSREIDVDNDGHGTWTPRMRCRDCRRGWRREEPRP